MEETTQPGVRLQRYLADTGLASRRACEEMIEAGRVTVNARVVKTLPVFVDPERDRVHVDGRPVARASKVGPRVYVMLYKPERVLCVSSDEPELGRTTVTQLVKHPNAQRLVPVGRLEYYASGLVIMTNDGELVNMLTHPKFGVAKTYHAVVGGSPDEAALSRMSRDMFKTDRRERRLRGSVGEARVDMRVIERRTTQAILEITLREGKNRSVAHVLRRAGLPVRKLTQIGIGPVRLTGVRPGLWRELTKREIHQLRRAASGDRRETPAPTHAAAPARRRPMAAKPRAKRDSE